jgi:UDP-N-acetylglucosamine--N-acetylmuramyl-(pentapeptide) pyrophosphoryl-undecaprenol N-acetylglucosamine transferase
MKILFTGGGTGGHFYRIIAVAEEMRLIAKQNHLIDVDMYYMSTTPYDAGLLFERNITFIQNSAGKIRRAASAANFIKNFFDLFKIAWGSLTSVWSIYKLYPDVVFGVGGYASFPALIAARILRIPVVIHETDSVPGKVNAWAGTFAQRIAVSYPEAARYFKAGKVAVTGCPIRSELLHTLSAGAFEFLKLDAAIPTLFVIGGSQGAQNINEAIVDSLLRLLNKYQIIHQTGQNNIQAVQEVAHAMLVDHPYPDRYKTFPYLNVLALRMSAGAARVVISRAGSAIFEIASWQKPSIIIPIPEPTSHDQTKNAFAYARTGAAVVMEEKNLTPHVLEAEIDRIMNNPEEQAKMSEAAKSFQHPDAAHKIATEILNIALSHEQ